MLVNFQNFNYDNYNCDAQEPCSKAPRELELVDPLFEAIIANEYHLVESLLTDVAIKSINRCHGTLGYPINAAVRTNNPELVRLLLANGAVPNVDEGSQAQQPLHIAVSNGNREILGFLLEYGALTDTLDSNGLTALHYAIVSGDEKVISMLLEHGSSLNISASDKTTPLQLAVLCLDEKAIKLLFKYGAGESIDCKDSSGDTPLHSAVKSGNHHLVELILPYITQKTMHIADVAGDTPLHSAVRLENDSLVTLLMSYGAEAAIGAANKFGDTPLHIAVRLNRENLIKFLLKHGASEFSHTPNRDGFTPFRVAIVNQRVAQVKWMMEGHSQNAKLLNVKDAFHVTDIQAAARTGNLELVNYLLSQPIEEEIVTSADVYFTEEELEGCRARSELPELQSIPLDRIAFPLTIAQNNCYTMIKLVDGRVLKLLNTNAVQARHYLMQAKYGSSWVNDDGSQILTTYVNPGHAFFGIRVKNDAAGWTYEATQGFYGNQKASGGNSFSLVQRVAQSVGLVSHNYEILGGNLKAFMVQEGVIKDERDQQEISHIQNFLKVDFYLTPKQMDTMIKTANDIQLLCSNKKYSYWFLTNNCFDYLSEVFSSAAEGQIMDFVTDRQANYGNLHEPDKLYSHSALNYGYLQSRGSWQYIMSGIGAAFNGIAKQSNVLPIISLDSGRIVDISQLRAKEEGKTTSISMSASYQVSLVENLLLARVISRVMTDSVNNLRAFFAKYTGKKVTTIELLTKCARMKKQVKKELFGLEKLSRRISKVRAGVLKFKDLENLKPFQHEVIDLIFDAVDLEDRIKALKMGKSLPSKRFLTSLEKQVTDFIDRSHATLKKQPQLL